MFHIALLISNVNYQPHYACVILYVFPLGHVYTFIIFKSYSKFCIFLTNIRIFFAYSAFKEENDLLRVKNKWLTLNFKFFITGFKKNVTIAYKSQFSKFFLLHDTEISLISKFVTYALTKYIYIYIYIYLYIYITIYILYMLYRIYISTNNRNFQNIHYIYIYIYVNTYLYLYNVHF